MVGPDRVCVLLEFAKHVPGWRRPCHTERPGASRRPAVLQRKPEAHLVWHWGPSAVTAQRGAGNDGSAGGGGAAAATDAAAAAARICCDAARANALHAIGALFRTPACVQCRRQESAALGTPLQASVDKSLEDLTISRALMFVL
jgi:hypothetical protein